MPIFCVNSVKIYTGQFFFTQTCLWCLWQIWGMIIDNVLVQAKINPTASYFIIAVLFVWSLHWFCACCKWPEENPFFGSSTQFALGSHPAGAKIHERLRTFDAFRKSGLFSGVINQACQMVQILVVHHFAPDICRYLGPSFIRVRDESSFVCICISFPVHCAAVGNQWVPCCSEYY